MTWSIGGINAAWNGLWQELITYNLSNTLALFKYKLLNLDIKTFQAISLGKKKLKRP